MAKVTQDERIKLEAAWQVCEGRLRAFLSRRVRAPGDVDELLQVISLKAVEKLSSLRDPGRLDRWLLRIARNALVDQVRRRGEQALSVELRAETSVAHEQVRAELSACVVPFLNQLPPIYGDALRAIDLEGGSQKELAERLGLSHSAVKSRVQRGRKLLADAFGRCCRFDLDARRNVLEYEAHKPGSCGCAGAEEES